MNRSEDSERERRLSDLPIVKHTDWLTYEDKNCNRMQHYRHPNNCCELLEQHTQSGCLGKGATSQGRCSVFEALNYKRACQSKTEAHPRKTGRPVQRLPTPKWWKEVAC